MSFGPEYKIMRLLVCVTCVVFFAGASTAAPSTDPEVAAARSAISLQRMSKLVRDLSAPAYDGRLPGSPGDTASRDYLVALFRATGLQPAGSKGYLLPFSTTITQPDGEDNPANPLLGKTVKTSNIIGVIPGNDPVLAKEVIIVSGHRDHLGHTPENVQYPGANDDLTGIAATVELARAFAAIQHKNKRTLMFVAFGAEEQDRMGSTFQVAHPVRLAPNRNIVLMMSIDMIGRILTPGPAFLNAGWIAFPINGFRKSTTTLQPIKTPILSNIRTNLMDRKPIAPMIMTRARLRHMGSTRG